MNKILLLTTLLALAYRATWAQDVSSVAILEYRLSKATDAVKASLDGLTLAGVTSALVTTHSPKVGVATTGGSGSGLTLDFTFTSDNTDGTITVATVNNIGSGYQIGDVITIAKAAIGGGTAGNLILTLVADDFVLARTHENRLSKEKDALLAAIDDVELKNGGGLTGASVTGKATTGGSGTGLTLDFTFDATDVTSVTVNNPGIGYKVGDAIIVDQQVIIAGADDADLTITLTSAHFIGGYLDVNGAEKQFVGNTKSGYHVSLQKTTSFVRVRASYTTAGSLTPTLGTATDATLVDDTISGTAFPVYGGLNILKLVSSADGTYELNLIRPDDDIKHIQGSKRSLEIAYNPGVVGEFTCAAFTNGATPPTSRGNVKTGTGVIAKSVRTHNILQENIFNSLQMALNGLSPSLEYDIYCYHSSHGIISNTATTVKTDLASLTAVSLVSTDESGTFDAGADTVTLTFTHEASLGSGNTIRLSLYTDFDTKQAIEDADATVTDCSSLVAITVGGNTVAVTSCAEDGENDLLITLSGSSTVSGSSGNVMTVVLTHNTALQFETNAAAGAKVTFNLEVTGHGKLLQQPGWTTS